MTVYFCRHGLATGSDDGSSWANAYRLANNAISEVLLVGSGHDLLVHSDTITHDATNNTVIVDGSINIYGGCDGTEAVPGDRADGAKTTVDGIDTYRCVSLTGTSLSNEFVGFKCVDGYHSSGGTGAGLHIESAATVSEVDVTGCSGVSAAVAVVSCAPVLEKVSSYGNTMGYQGGGFLINQGVDGTLLVNCLSADNSSQYGGGIYVLGAAGVPSYARLVNCGLINNTVDYNGGAIRNNVNVTGVFSIENTVVWGNSGGGSIIADANGGLGISYSCVQGYVGSESWDDGNNNADNPQFIGTGENVYDLSDTSPASITEGANQSADNYPVDDVLGRTRADGSIGAYEYVPGSGTVLSGSSSSQSSSTGEMTGGSSGIVYFCDPSAVGSDNGSTWENAFVSLQDAHDTATPGIDRVWVKSRTIITTGYTGNYFYLSNSVEIYGGFANTLTGTQGSVSGRDLLTNMTTISGDNVSGNRCMFVNGIPSDRPIMSGFIFTGGNRDDPPYGNAIQAVSPITLEDCIIEDNNGQCTAAIFYGTSNVVLRRVLIQNNVNADTSTWTYGGGCDLNLCDFLVEDCFIINNEITDDNVEHAVGGGLRVLGTNGGSSKIVNTLIAGNTVAYGFGGGLYIEDAADVKLINVTVTGNEVLGLGTSHGVRIYNDANAEFVNTIAYDNVNNTSLESNLSLVTTGTFTATYSCIGAPSVYTGVGNTNDDPQFKGTGDDVYDLSNSTPVSISAGADTGDTDYPSEDILERTRTDGSMGAYEYVASGFEGSAGSSSSATGDLGQSGTQLLDGECLSASTSSGGMVVAQQLVAASASTSSASLQNETATGWLHTSGNRIYDSNDEVWQGRGANIHDVRGCWSCTSTEGVAEVKHRLDALVGDWGATFVRLCLESYDAFGNMADDPVYAAKIIEIVEYARDTYPDCFVLVSVWADDTLIPEHTNPRGWFPTEATKPMWTAMATAFAKSEFPNVMFGLCNEPHYNNGTYDVELWTRFNDGVKIIRDIETANGSPEHIITVQGTTGWGRPLDYYITNPITYAGGSNIAYECHAYDAASTWEDPSYSAYSTRWVLMQEELPIIIGEFGPAGGMSEADAELLMETADTLQVPWLAWTFHQRCPPNLLVDNADPECNGTMTLTPTSPWGVAVFDALGDVPENFTADCSSSSLCSGDMSVALSAFMAGTISSISGLSCDLSVEAAPPIVPVILDGSGSSVSTATAVIDIEGQTVLAGTAQSASGAYAGADMTIGLSGDTQSSTTATATIYTLNLISATIQSVSSVTCGLSVGADILMAADVASVSSVSAAISKPYGFIALMNSISAGSADMQINDVKSLEGVASSESSSTADMTKLSDLIAASASASSITALLNKPSDMAALADSTSSATTDITSSVSLNALADSTSGASCNMDIDGALLIDGLANSTSSGEAHMSLSLMQVYATCESTSQASAALIQDIPISATAGSTSSMTGALVSENLSHRQRTDIEPFIFYM